MDLLRKPPALWNKTWGYYLTSQDLETYYRQRVPYDLTLLRAESKIILGHTYGFRVHIPSFIKRNSSVLRRLKFLSGGYSLILVRLAPEREAALPAIEAR
jgi:hypothetical protein